ncbi:MAG TPA: GntR family transcriptional regulator [Baekduia sp.]|nr:GntR family transcriptional regulator [Baekduia sp.]
MTGPALRPSQAERVYELLRDQLLAGALPAGERLVEMQLATRFATSRTPVREALRRLEGDGHLVRDPTGGLRPRLPDVRTMTEVYDVRLALEELTARRASTGGDRELLEAVEHDWRALERQWHSDPKALRTPDFVHRDEAFHERIAGASCNATATRMLRSVNERIRVLRIHDFTLDERIGATIAEHLEIVGLVLAGDADAAAAFMRAHVQRSALVVRERVGESLARMFAVPST